MQKPRKYLNVKTEVDGIKFDSKREAREYGNLVYRQRAGEISHLEVHPKFLIVVNGVRIGSYTADFKFMDKAEGRFRVIDIKSPSTAKNTTFRIKKRLVEALYPGTKIEVAL